MRNWKTKSKNKLDKLTYQIIRKPGKRAITITVSAHNEIKVSAPSGVSQKMIDEVLRRQHSWILKRLKINEALKVEYPAKTYQAGEIFHFLGKPHTLGILKGTRRGIDFKEGKLEVTFSEDEGEDPVPEIIQAWYESAAHSFLKNRIDFYEKRMDLKSISLEIKTLNSFWGSCRNSGHLKFNAKLMMAPPEVIDYVVVHELAHISHPNHSRKFWGCVEGILPDYPVRRRWLTRHGQYLSF